MTRAEPLLPIVEVIMIPPFRLFESSDLIRTLQRDASGSWWLFVGSEPDRRIADRQILRARIAALNGQPFELKTRTEIAESDQAEADR